MYSWARCSTRARPDAHGEGQTSITRCPTTRLVLSVLDLRPHKFVLGSLHLKSPQTIRDWTRYIYIYIYQTLFCLISNVELGLLFIYFDNPLPSNKGARNLALVPICCDGSDALLSQMLYQRQTRCMCWRPDAQLEQMSNPLLNMILSALDISLQGFVFGSLLPKKTDIKWDWTKYIYQTLFCLISTWNLDCHFIYSDNL